MTDEKGLGKFFVYCGLMLILFLVMIPIIFSFSGKLIRAEVLVFLFLLLLGLIGFVGYQKDWGERVLFFMFVIGLANLIFIWVFTSRLFLLPLVLGLIGFVMSWPRKEDEWEEGIEGGEEPYSEVLEDEGTKEEGSSEEEKPGYLIKNSEEKIKEELVEKRRKVETEYYPGKYVASEMGSVYHIATCDWAKRIKKKRQVWFKDKREAGKKGYKKHKCVK